MEQKSLSAAKSGSENEVIRLKWNEHIRLRPYMYLFYNLGLGEEEDLGYSVYTLLKSVIDDAVFEYVKGFGNNITVSISDTTASVRDFGRGYPLRVILKNVCRYTYTNTPLFRGRFEEDIFPKDIIHMYTRVHVVNALSANFYVASYYDGLCSWASCSEGVLVGSGTMESDEQDGTFISFTPDRKIFENYSFKMSLVEQMIRFYCCMRKGLTIILNGTKYSSNNGLLDLFNEKLTIVPLYTPIYLKGDDIEIVITHTSVNQPMYYSYVNGHFTKDGGTHQASLKRAITRTFKRIFGKQYTTERCHRGVTAAVSIHILDAGFENSMQTILGSRYMYDWPWRGRDHIGPTIDKYISRFIGERLPLYFSRHQNVYQIIKDLLIAD